MYIIELGGGNRGGDAEEERDGLIKGGRLGVVLEGCEGSE